MKAAYISTVLLHLFSEAVGWWIHNEAVQEDIQRHMAMGQLYALNNGVPKLLNKS